MSIADELSEFDFSAQSIVRDPEKFRSKLNIGADAFKKLTQLEHVGEGGLALLSGGGLAAMSWAVWLATLGPLAKLGLLFGIVATPGGWIVVAGTLAASTVYGGRKLYHRFRRNAIKEVPHFINTPIDVLGAAICSLIAPVLVRVAYADQQFAEEEKMTVRNYFVGEWGMSETYVDRLLCTVENNRKRFTYSVLRVGLEKVAERPELAYKTMAKEIVDTATAVMNADNHAHPLELAELQRLRDALAC